MTTPSHAPVRISQPRLYSVDKAERRLRRGELKLWLIALVALAALAEAGDVCSQEPASNATPLQEPLASTVKPQTSPLTSKHPFWDKKNGWLFAGVGAGRTLDYFSTLNMRRRGRQEILLTNDVVDNHAAFAAVEAAGTGVSIGASYLFHYYGHHKLERWTSIIHFGLATTGAARNYSLTTAHAAPAP